jgi:hypothetical protein
MPKEATKKKTVSPVKTVAPEPPAIKNTDRKDVIISSSPTKGLFEIQGLAPSPNNTFYQLVVQESEVVLNEWPRMRLSQRWTRNGGMNPQAKTVTAQEYLDGEWKQEITFIFGKDAYEKSVKALKVKLGL